MFFKALAVHPMWIFDQNLWNGNFPGGPGVKTVLTTQRVWFPSLIRELRSQMPHGLAKKKVWYQGRGRPWTFWLFIPCYEKKIWCRQYWREKWTWIKDWMIPAPPLAPSCLHSITLFPGVDGPEWKGVAFWHDNAQTLTISVLPALKRAELFMPATPFFPRLKKKKKNEAGRGEGTCTQWNTGGEKMRLSPPPAWACSHWMYCFGPSFLILELSLLCELQSSPTLAPPHHHHQTLSAHLCVKNKESGFPWWPSG